MANKCGEALHKWIQENPEKVAKIYRAAQAMSLKDAKIISSRLEAIARHRMLDDSTLGWSAAMDQAKGIYTEEIKVQMEEARKNARLNVLKKVELIASGDAAKWNPKDSESSLFQGSSWRGKGVKNGVQQMINGIYLKLGKAKGGLWQRLEEENGIAMLQNRAHQVTVADQIIKQSFTNDHIGRIARIVNEHDDLQHKLLREAGIPVTKLLARITMQIHNGMKILNPKGLKKAIKADPDYRRGMSSLEKANLRTKVAFKMWSDTMLQFVDKRTSFMDIAPDDEQGMRNVLRETFDDVVNKMYNPKRTDVSSGKMTFAARAASGMRRYHFKDGESVIAYHEAYGAGSLLDALEMDMKSTANKIGVVTKFGPNAEDNFLKYMRTMREKNLNNPKQLNKYTRTMGLMFDNVMGRMNGGTSSKLSTFFENVQAFNNITKLGFVVLHSLSDVPNMWGQLSYAGVSFPYKIQASLRVAREMFQPGSGDDEDFLSCLGVGVKHAIGGANRFNPDSAFSGTMSKLNNIMFTTNGLKRWDNGLRTTVSAVMSHYLARNADKPFEKLNPKLKRLLTLYDWSPEEWEVWRQNGLKGEGAEKYLCPESFRDAPEEMMKDLDLSREQLYTKSLSFFDDQYHQIVPSSDLKTSTMTKYHSQTPWGGALNLILQYKQYSMGFVRTTLARNLRGTDSTGEMFGSMVQNIVGTMAMGYLGTQAGNLIRGKPISSLSDLATWVESILPALGIYGDVVGTLTSNKMDAVSELAGGPALSGLNDYAQYLHAMGERVFSPGQRHRKSAALLTYQLAKRNIPFANTMYAQGLLNMGIGHAIMDHLQPGSYEQMIARQQHAQRG